MPLLKELLKEKVVSKEQLDNILIAADRNNRKYLGRAERRDPVSRELLESRMPYATLSNFYIGGDCSDQMYRINEAQNLVGMHRPPSPTVGGGGGGAGTGTYHHTRWWLLREHMRMALAGDTCVTESMLPMVFRFPELAIHMKGLPDDEPTTVWYTPDPQAGERDAQVKTSISRLLRKLYPQEPDEVIRDIEAAHRSELNNEIEFIPSDKIAEAYQEGPGSCMSYSAAHWSADGHHPCEVYDAPGFALAVNRREGEINSRCLVWVNPENPEDKRWVRNYGDTALTRKLGKAGYRCAGLAGARIRRVELESQDNPAYVRVLMPYIDYPNGGDGEKAGRTVVLDGEWIRIVSDKHNDLVTSRLRALSGGLSMTTAGGTGGYVAIYRRFDMAALSATCPFTGYTFTPSEFTTYVMYEGQRRAVSPSVADELKAVRTQALMHTGVTVEEVWVDDTTPLFSDPERTDSLPIVDTPQARQQYGYVELCQEFYPDVKWAKADKVSRVQDADGDWTLVLASDTVDLIHMVDGRPRVSPKHKSQVPNLKKLKVVHRYESHRQTVVEPDVPVVKTAGGRSVVVGVHQVFERIDGSFDFPHKMKDMRVMGMSFRVDRSGSRPSDSVIMAATRKRLLEEVEREVALELEAVYSNEGLFETSRNGAFFALGRRMNRLTGGALVQRNGELRFIQFTSYRAHNDHTDGGARNAILESIASMQAMPEPHPDEYVSGLGNRWAIWLYVGSVLPALIRVMELLSDDAIRASLSRDTPQPSEMPQLIAA